MPITSSAKKASRQNVRRKAANRARKDRVHDTIKAYRKLVAAKQYDEAARELTKVYAALDKVAKKGTIKKNKASRLKSRMAALLKKK
jgi:small subunit ribosomal protein S20